MTKFLPKDPVFLTIGAVFLLLPFAQIKILFFGVPLYLPEIALLTAFGLRSLFFVEGVSWKNVFFRDTLVTAGISFLILGAVISLLVHPTSLTGWGMLKSWFFFPVFAFWLISSEAFDSIKRRAFIVLWFVVLVATAFWNLWFVVFDRLTFDGRLAGTYPSPNFLAIFIAPALPLALYLFSLLQEGDRWTHLKKKALFFGVLIVLICLFFTHSYGVWAALIFSLCIFLFGKTLLFGLQKNTILLSCIFLVGVIIFGFLEFGSTKWQALTLLDSRSSLSSRLMIWQAAEKMIEDQPLFGIGLGRFQEVYLEYQHYFPPYLEWAVPEPHSLYLALLLHTGSIGFFGFILLIGRFMFVAVRTFFSKRSEDTRVAALFLFSLSLLFLFYGLVDTPYFKNDLALTFFLFLGLGFSQFWHEETYQEEKLQS